MGRGNRSVGQALHTPPTRKENSEEFFITIAGKKILAPGEERGFAARLDEDPDTRGENVLVLPTKGNFTRADEWTEEERLFRSLMFHRESGQVVSAGLPKFFNYGEEEQDTQLLNKTLAKGDQVLFTEKMDGSLLIRSVINGKVRLRTRGTTLPGFHGEAASQVILDKYPVLNDPEFQPDASLLFEFVTPDPNFKIVIDYPEPDLILLHQIDHDDLGLADHNSLIKLADSEKLRLVETRDVPNDPEELLAHIKELEGSEGVVARVDDSRGARLVKLKSADYLLRHRLRYSLNTKAVRQVCIERNVTELSDFEEYLREQEADWELARDSKPLVETFVQAKKAALSEVSLFAKEIEQKKKEFPDRGDFARNYASRLDKPLPSVAFALLDGKKETAESIILNNKLDEAYADIEIKESYIESLISSDS